MAGDANSQASRNVDASLAKTFNAIMLRQR
jgi:hypothetical protein